MLRHERTRPHKQGRTIPFAQKESPRDGRSTRSPLVRRSHDVGSDPGDERFRNRIQQPSHLMLEHRRPLAEPPGGEQLFAAIAPLSFDRRSTVDSVSILTQMSVGFPRVVSRSSQSFVSARIGGAVDAKAAVERVGPRNVQNRLVPLFDSAEDGSSCLRDRASEDRVVGDLVVADEREELVRQAGDQLRQLVAGPCRVGVGVKRADLSRGRSMRAQRQRCRCRSQTAKRCCQCPRSRRSFRRRRNPSPSALRRSTGR